MKIKKTDLKKLKSALPKGSAIVLRSRLTTKGQSYSKQYIYRVLDPDHPDYNSLIIEEAVCMVEEEKLHRTLLSDRIRLFKKTA